MRCGRWVVKEDEMPLSEHEQRILQEIERSFYEHDPAFAQRVRSETVYRHAGRACKWSVLAFLAGFVFLVFTFTTSVVLGLLGFLVMLGAALVFERNLRRMGRAGLAEINASVREEGLPESFGDLRRRWRRRAERPKPDAGPDAPPAP